MKFLNHPVAGWASETKLNFAVRKCPSCTGGDPLFCPAVESLNMTLGGHSTRENQMRFSLFRGVSCTMATLEPTSWTWPPWIPGGSLPSVFASAFGTAPTGIPPRCGLCTCSHQYIRPARLYNSPGNRRPSWFRLWWGSTLLQSTERHTCRWRRKVLPLAGRRCKQESSFAQWDSNDLPLISS
jgi:hypothetical protein